MALELKSRRADYHAAKSIHSQRKTKKRIVRMFVWAIVLILLLVTAAFVYTWYMGRFAPPIVNEAPLKRVVPQTTPQKIDDTAKVGVASQSFTSKVERGKNASLIIKTNPLAACSIRVEYDKQASQDSGLVPKKADDYGVVSWAWTVEDSRPLGKWPVVITCANTKNSAVLALDLFVVNPQ